ncbi:MAG: DUF1573 domain-containing protein [Chitinophagaceae bacterium]|nr:DUF1573 domain-containing protein [Chitinophagaceae bacterium]
MKKIFFVAALFISQFAFSQTGVEFKTSSHQFGKVKKGIPVSYTFTFKNVSDKPVVIEFANADCGCTTPDYPKTAIVKKQSGDIKVTYNAAVTGIFKKSVNVKFANSNQPYILTVEGEVVEAIAKTKNK